MRDYGRVHCAFWTSTDVQAMSEDARTLALYLLTCPHTTIAGVMRLPDGYVIEDVRWSIERVIKGFSELFDKGFAYRCLVTKWVWIRKFFTWNRPENPNQWKAALKVAQSVPANCSWRTEFLEFFASISGKNVETLREPFRNQDQDQDQKQYQKQEQEEEADSQRGAASVARRMRSKRRAEFNPESIPGLNVAAWNCYIEHRRSIRAKPLGSEGCLLLATRLATHDVSTQQVMIDQSRMNGWTGVFDLKGLGNGSGNQTKPWVPARTVAQMEADEAAAALVGGEGSDAQR